MKLRLSVVSLAAALATASVLPGCGGGGSSGGVTAPSGGGRQIVTQSNWTLVPGAWQSGDVSITGASSTKGTLDAVVEWTFATNDVDIYVTATACTPDMFVLQRCAYAAKADSATTKPERVSFSVSGGDTYRVWVVNFGPTNESGTLEVGLTR
jgi:hypothetical protein